MNDTLLTVKDASVGYAYKTVAKGISFSVQEEDFLCILGRNGVGKSTLLKTLLGLTPLLGGEINFNPKVKTKVGYLPQQDEVQKDFPASVNEVVLSGFAAQKKLFPFYTTEEKKLARENCLIMGLAGLEKKSYRLLSGGQKQKVLLARALCALYSKDGAKPILLMDEPTASLDPEAREAFNVLLQTLNREKSITIIQISHDVDWALKSAKHILYVADRSLFLTAEAFKNTEGFKTLVQKGEA